ncbi:MAG: pseudoazurin [Pseudomonadota bacterium]|nr:pseudoazurin [Pseudomonadota bacterium]
MNAWISMRAIGLALVIAAVSFISINPSYAEVHEVKMYNKDPNDKKKRMVFVPRVLKINPGDTVKFIASSKGHNSASIKGMLPKGAKKWKSKIGKNFELTLNKVGVYGYKCTPHYGMGMVGLIVVKGDNWDANLESAKGAKKAGKSKKVFKEIWTELGASN